MFCRREFSGDVELLVTLPFRFILYLEGYIRDLSRDGAARNESGLGCMQGPICISRPLICPIFSSLGILCESALLVLIIYLLSE